MRRVLLAIGLLAPGCDQVIGLERRPSEVTVRYEVHEVRNAPEGTPMVVATDEPRFIEVVLDDGGVPELVSHPDGSRTFERDADDQGYRLLVRSPQGDAVVEYQLTAASLAIVEPMIGRVDRSPPAGGALVEQRVPNAPAGSTTYLVTTGLWSETSHLDGEAGATNAAFRLPWGSARSRFGPIGSLVAEQGDRAYAVSTGIGTGKNGTPYFALTHACENTFTILGFLSVGLSCEMQPIVRERCTHVATRFDAELARIEAALPPIAHPTKFYGWFLGATPAPTLRPDIDLHLGSRFAITETTVATDETNDELMYGNPYPGHTVNLMTRATREREVAVADAPPTLLATGTRYWSAPSGTCAGPGPVAGPVSVASAMALGGTPLDQDARLVETAPDLRLRWDVSSGTADLYRVVLSELFVFGVTLRAPLRTYVVTEPSVRLDPALLQAGRTYVISVEAELGWPGAATGDFGATAFPAAPYATSIAWSSTFRVP